MKYNTFVMDVKEKVQEFIDNKYENAEVVIREITKNNGVNLKAIGIAREGENTSPSIYLPSFFAEYLQGLSIEKISNSIIDIYEEHRDDVNFDVNEFTEYEKMREKLFIKLVNYDLNKNSLEDMPHIKILDMAIVFYAIVSKKSLDILTVTITNDHIKSWNISIDELYRNAKENSEKMLKPQIKEMEEIISEMILDDIMGKDEEVEEKLPGTFFMKEDYVFHSTKISHESDQVEENFQYGMYNYDEVQTIIKEEVESFKPKREISMFVLTNHIKLNGASCMIYSNVLKDFAKEKNSDIYIVPSSIHEVILIPGNNLDKNFINDMIKDVNTNEVEDIEILSDHVYVYSREKACIIM